MENTLRPAPTICDTPVAFHRVSNNNTIPDAIDTSSPIEKPSIDAVTSLKPHGLRLSRPRAYPLWLTLDYSSLDQLALAKHHLPVLFQRKIDALYRKQQLFPDRYLYLEDYLPQCSLVAFLEHRVSNRVCFCGLKGKAKKGVNPSSLCGRPRFCPYCAYRGSKKTLGTFQQSFHGRRWGFLTISYKKLLPFTHTSGNDWIVHWQAATAAIERLVGIEATGGAMVREELAISSLCPTTVQPHVHAVVPTSHLSPESLDLLKKWVVAYCDNSGYSVTSEPSIVFKPIPSEEDFVRVVRYSRKPIDLVLPYQSRWALTKADKDKVAVNSAIRDIMEACVAIPEGRPQIRYFGNMRAASKRIFIGVPKSERN